MSVEGSYETSYEARVLALCKLFAASATLLLIGCVVCYFYGAWVGWVGHTDCVSHKTEDQCRLR